VVQDDGVEGDIVFAKHAAGAFEGLETGGFFAERGRPHEGRHGVDDADIVERLPVGVEGAVAANGFEEAEEAVAAVSRGLVECGAGDDGEGAEGEGFGGPGREKVTGADEVLPGAELFW
jgi:hypothetical protein